MSSWVREIQRMLGQQLPWRRQQQWTSLRAAKTRARSLSCKRFWPLLGSEIYTFADRDGRLVLLQRRGIRGMAQQLLSGRLGPISARGGAEQRRRGRGRRTKRYAWLVQTRGCLIITTSTTATAVRQPSHSTAKLPRSSASRRTAPIQPHWLASRLSLARHESRGGRCWQPMSSSEAQQENKTRRVQMQRCSG